MAITFIIFLYFNQHRHTNVIEFTIIFLKTLNSYVFQTLLILHQCNRSKYCLVTVLCNIS